MKYLIKRCAELHLEHIRSKDPFESGSSRPLDFGHWSAHKLEQLTDFAIRHGDAVAIGIALDSVYSHLTGRLSSTELEMIISVIKRLGFAITHPLLEVSSVESPLLRGLEEFREHLGGKLTITLLNGIGKGEEVHSMDGDLIRKSGEWLQRIA
jgi:3-dehydroquinate synthase